MPLSSCLVAARDYKKQPGTNSSVFQRKDTKHTIKAPGASCFLLIPPGTIPAQTVSIILKLKPMQRTGRLRLEPRGRFDADSSLGPEENLYYLKFNPNYEDYSSFTKTDSLEEGAPFLGAQSKDSVKLWSSAKSSKMIRVKHYTLSVTDVSRSGQAALLHQV